MHVRRHRAGALLRSAAVRGSEWGAWGRGRGGGGLSEWGKGGLLPDHDHREGDVTEEGGGRGGREGERYLSKAADDCF